MKKTGLKIAIKLYSPPSPPPLGGHTATPLARPQTIRPVPNMLENGLTQFMQFRQQQQQAAAAAAAQADLFARLGRPLPRLPLPLPLPFLHAHMAAAKFGNQPGFADNLRARFHGFAAAAVSSASNASSSTTSTSPPMGGGALPPPNLSCPPLRTSPSSGHEAQQIMPQSLMTQMGQTSPSCRNPYQDEGPMSPNGKLSIFQISWCIFSCFYFGGENI